MPAPPPNAASELPDLSGDKTTRELVEAVTEAPNTSCAGCHTKQINPLGFAMEHYDAVGRWRTEENGKTIDTSGELVGLEDMFDDTKVPFQGPRELGAMLAESGSAQDCLTLQYYRFARGYQEQASDACSLDKMKKRFEGENLTIKELLVSIALLDSFTLRGE